jgi:LmbE family N-acetylglucosaminyl deacetylase
MSAPPKRGAGLRVARRLLAPTLAFVLAASSAPADPRAPVVMDAAGIRLALEKLNVVGSALYVGAHPDDENTAFLAWLANGRKVRTAYLSLTRGDGGQNLIGSDTGELLGVIRTQELLAARRIDGAEQLFSRAIDFGFSKNPEETLEIWGHDRILADVVWAVRRFRPDIIVTRFAPDSTAGHGHHTASALLAEEAFVAAADPARFPEQLRSVKPWQAKRLMRNIGRFGNAGSDTTPGRLNVDLGAYDPLLGRSYTEIAGESRSMHKTQGFGAAERRGTYTNSFELRAGAPAPRDLFDGVDLTWARFPGAARLTPILAQAAREFRADHPAAIVPLLLKAHAILATLGDDPLVERKRQELGDVIRACTGLWMEAIASVPAASPGRNVRVTTSVLNRSEVAMTLQSVRIGPVELPSWEEHAPLASRIPRQLLGPNTPANDTLAVGLQASMRTSEPYWLRDPALRGSFTVDDQNLIGTPENAPALIARFILAIAGKELEFTVPVVYRWTDPVAGERYRAFEVVPPATMQFDQGVYLFADDRPRDLRVSVRSADVPVAGALSLTLPAGWSASPASAAIQLRAGEADTTVRFLVTPGATPAAATVGAELTTASGRLGSRLIRLDYPHVPIQTLLPRAEAHLVRADLKTAGHEIGYLMGSGDQGPEALRQMGFHVTLLSDADVEDGDLGRFDAIVAGVRVYNTRPRVRAQQRRLLAYAEAGGRLVLQYDTADDVLQDRLGPWPLRISRDRVTVEEAPITLLKPDHPLLTSPNRIVASDFDGWVQERGLYFANPWDPRYESLLSSHDPNEPARDGGLLAAHVGKGMFIYTGYAFFRQLPAGVPGAWRLFANLVSAAR